MTFSEKNCIIGNVRDYILQIGFTHEIRRNKIMKTFDLLLSSINDVKDFVNIVSKYDFDVDLTSGRYVVDAKSIMGIFSLDLSKPKYILMTAISLWKSLISLSLNNVA